MDNLVVPAIVSNSTDIPDYANVQPISLTNLAEIEGSKVISPTTDPELVGDFPNGRQESIVYYVANGQQLGRDSTMLVVTPSPVPVATTTAPNSFHNKLVVFNQRLKEAFKRLFSSNKENQKQKKPKETKIRKNKKPPTEVTITGT